MGLYCGIDLHSNNHVLTVIDEVDRRVYERRLPNDLAITKATLEPYRAELVAVAVESTFNWDWSVDGLMEAGYAVRLVNTAATRPVTQSEPQYQIAVTRMSRQSYRQSMSDCSCEGLYNTCPCP
jgi:transposase